jgi:ABC-type antimicrobial peptide transport system ATPase subunit
MTIFAIALLHLRLDPRCKLVGTVHDSIMYYVPNSILNESAKLIKYTCENLPTNQFFGRYLSKVSLKVDVEFAEQGQSWKDLKPLELK